IAQSVFGFCSLFFGLCLMSVWMAVLSSLDIFHDLIVNMSDNPILGVAIGMVFTLVVQSSSATIGILQGLYAEQAISLQAAIPVLFCDNLSITIKSILDFICGSVAA